MSQKITEHFTLEEFHCKDGTPYPKEWIRDRLISLCKLYLEPIRAAFNKPITITSGYRTKAYNNKVSKSKFSQHIQGRAADFKVAGVPARKVAEKVKEMMTKGIIPKGGIGTYPSWTHVDSRLTNRIVFWHE